MSVLHPIRKRLLPLGIWRNAGNCRQSRYPFFMSQLAKLTSRIDPELLAELNAFVQRSGMSKQAVIQMALAAWLEDAEDLELIEQRRNEGDFVSFDEAKRAFES